MFPYPRPHLQPRESSADEVSINFRPSCFVPVLHYFLLDVSSTSRPRTSYPKRSREKRGDRRVSTQGILGPRPLPRHTVCSAASRSSTLQGECHFLVLSTSFTVKKKKKKKKEKQILSFIFFTKKINLLHLQFRKPPQIRLKRNHEPSVVAVASTPEQHVRGTPGCSAIQPQPSICLMRNGKPSIRLPACLPRSPIPSF